VTVAVHAMRVSYQRLIEELRTALQASQRKHTVEVASGLVCSSCSSTQFARHGWCDCGASRDTCGPIFSMVS
jgi:hypothetical protein